MKRGFTLVELLAVIIILAAIILIVIPTVNNIITSSKKSLSKTQIKSIEKAAEQYYLSEGMNDNENCIDINYLIESGYIDADKINNPKNGEELTGSVKIEYKNNKYTYTYSDDRCAICDVIVGDGTSIGDKLVCEVKPGSKYNFYVLSKEDDDTVNLIMDQNIYSDGTPAEINAVTQSENANKYSLVAWNSSGSTSTPETAMNFLYNATKDWINLNPIKELKYHFGYDGTTEEPLRARMPVYSATWHIEDMTAEYKVSESGELADKKEDNSNAYLYENLSSNSNKAPIGYWTASVGEQYPYVIWVLTIDQLTHFGPDENLWIGVRPVVNVSNTDIQTVNPPTHICEGVNKNTVTTGNIPEGYYEPGDEYICEVKPGVKYHFFVVSEEKNKVNLILEANISEDGKPVTTLNQTAARIAWASNEDYYKDVGGVIPDHLLNDDGACQNGGYCALTNKGPITAISKLNDITSSWKNITNLNETYDDLYGMYEKFALNGKARLLTYTEAIDAGCRPPEGVDSSEFLYHCPLWIVNYTSNLADVYVDGTKLSTGGYDYWTMDSNSENMVMSIYIELGMFTANTLGVEYSVRPVISVSKNSIK